MTSGQVVPSDERLGVKGLLLDLTTGQADRAAIALTAGQAAGSFEALTVGALTARVLSMP